MTNPLISASGLAELLGQPNVKIFDVRHDLMDHAAGRRAYDQGHIPSAYYLDHELDLAAARTGSNGRHPLPSREHLAGLLGALGVEADTFVVAYDASGGMFAAHLWWMLRWLGHERVAVLDGGWPAWLALSLPVSVEKTLAPTLPTGPSHQGLVRTPLMSTVDADGVLENLVSPRFTVLDARANNRFRGEVEPMDPVAGHIPGALNRPNVQNLQENGLFKQPAVLRAEFESLLGNLSPAAVVHQCGSGITACHNLFAMEVAGLSGSRLYPGSWSEWCSDASRPVARDI